MYKSSGDVLKSLLEYVETSYVHIFEDGIQYCQIIIVNMTAVSDVDQSIPASVTAGFPIGMILSLKFVIIMVLIHVAAPQLFQSHITVVVTFPKYGTPMANNIISFMVCNNSVTIIIHYQIFLYVYRLHLFVTIRQRATRLQFKPLPVLNCSH